MEVLGTEHIIASAITYWLERMRCLEITHYIAIMSLGFVCIKPHLRLSSV
jgi:hypothetical protein